MRQEAAVSEAMILSTCNRVELYGRSDETTGAGARLEEFLCAFHGRPVHEIGPYLYRLADGAAIRHAFRVAASLESMVIGEPQILGQVKEAYQAAEDAGTLGSALNALRNRSLAAAKRARSETGIGKNAVSVSYVAVELARKIFGELKDKNGLLVGAGKKSELAARHLVRSGARATVLVGRTIGKADELAAAEALVAAEVGEFLEWQKSLDVVPLLVELRRRGEEIRRAEIEKARARLGALTPEQEQALEAATTAIVNKMLHGPTVQLKELA